MVRLRKQRRRKVYRYNANRKRLRNKVLGVGKVKCKQLKEAWDTKKSIYTNYKEMGLSSDANKTIPIPSASRTLSVSSHSNNSGNWEETELEQQSVVPKKYVADALEQEAKAPRVKLFRLPKGQVEWITYLMDKYGTDYKAMVRDKKNYNQETWKQLRAKIKRFKAIPEQYRKYLEERGLNPEDFEEKDTPESDDE